MLIHCCVICPNDGPGLFFLPYAVIILQLNIVKHHPLLLLLFGKIS